MPEGRRLDDSHRHHLLLVLLHLLYFSRLNHLFVLLLLRLCRVLLFLIRLLRAFLGLVLTMRHGNQLLLANYISSNRTLSAQITWGNYH